MAGAESVGVRGNFANMSVSGAEPSPSTAHSAYSSLEYDADDVTQNFLYGSFQVEHSNGFIMPGHFKRSLVKYFELGHESYVRAGRDE